MVDQSFRHLPLIVNALAIILIIKILLCILIIRSVVIIIIGRLVPIADAKSDVTTGLAAIKSDVASGLTAAKSDVTTCLTTTTAVAPPERLDDRLGGERSGPTCNHLLHVVKESLGDVGDAEGLVRLGNVLNDNGAGHAVRLIAVLDDPGDRLVAGDLDTGANLGQLNLNI